MRSWTPADIYRPITKNILFYEGPSQLNGEPIFAIATAQNGNRKIGHMLQLWIVPAISPILAVKSGRDSAVCGDCKHRGDGRGKDRSCYVEWWRSVENIWQARAKARQMSSIAMSDVTRGMQLRIGAYGDPVAVPMPIWGPLLRTAAGWTAYTHQWRIADPEYRSFCMASVDSLDEQIEAASIGWRTYRVRQSVDDALLNNEIICPASEEGGHRTVCARCELCRGAGRPAKHVAIAAHGSGKVHFLRTVGQL